MQGESKNPDNDQEFSLEEILKECMDSEGYVIMTGVISKRTDSKGHPMLDFKYRRYHFSHEDVKIAIDKFKTFHIDDEASG